MTAPAPDSRGMEIWVDADACPAAIKEIVFRAAIRTQVRATLVANRLLRTPPSPWVRAIQVPGGFDVADQRIAAEARAGDLVITADIPLAAEVIPRGALVLTPRGERYTPENIRERLTLRDFMDQMRASGFDTAGPAPLAQSDRHAFAAELDRLLAAYAARRKTAPQPPDPAPARRPDEGG